MKAVDAERQELLCILLIEAYELLADTAQCVFEVSRHDWTRIRPHSLH